MATSRFIVRRRQPDSFPLYSRCPRPLPILSFSYIMVRESSGDLKSQQPSRSRPPATGLQAGPQPTRCGGWVRSLFTKLNPTSPGGVFDFLSGRLLRSSLPSSQCLALSWVPKRHYSLTSGLFWGSLPAQTQDKASCLVKAGLGGQAITTAGNRWQRIASNSACRSAALGINCDYARPRATTLLHLWSVASECRPLPTTGSFLAPWRTW
jgi:hypothetical protein